MGDIHAPIPRSPFRRFLVASSMSSLGSAVTAVAMPILVVQHLGATSFEVGVVNAAQFLPYAVLGLVAGVYVDRWRRKPVLVWVAVGRALTLGVVPALWLAGALHIWLLVVMLVLFGVFSVFGFAASQSLVPSLVPRAGLVGANSRLDQADAAAATLGPALGGGLVGLMGAPLAIVVDALSFLAEAILLARIRVSEPRNAFRIRNLPREIRDGAHWMYRHGTLRPLAVSTHIWFLANGAAVTVLAVFALRSLGLTAVTFGLLLTMLGIASLIGASVAPWCGRRIGSLRVIIVARVAYPIAWALVAATPSAGGGLALLFAAMGIQGITAGIENSNEMAYWQTLTPDDLLGRVNGTRRSINRTAAALGAVGAGVLVGLIGDRLTLVTVTGVFAIAAISVAKSPLRQKDVS